MRTKVDSGWIWRNVVVIALVTERCDAIMARYAGSGSVLRFTSHLFLMAFNFFARAVKTGYRTASVRR